MKKLLLLAVSAMTFSALPAFAEDAKPADAPKGGEQHGMMKADANGDGVITKAEFLANSETMFTELDKDNDGKISKAELDAKREEWRKKMAALRDQRRAAKAGASKDGAAAQ